MSTRADISLAALAKLLGAIVLQPSEAPDALCKLILRVAGGCVTEQGESLAISAGTAGQLPGFQCKQFEISVVRKLLKARGYEVLGPAGEGGVGQVWLVLDAAKRQFRRPYRAVKLIRDVSRFKELSSLGCVLSLGHPGLINIHSFEKSEDGTVAWYVMDPADDYHLGPAILDGLYVPCDLGNYIAKRGALPLFECVGIALKLCDVLAYLHGHELVHRDVKPANIVRVGYEWKLADIGLVAPIGADANVGTPGYAPPEMHGWPTGDIYSLGVLIYRMMTGNCAPERVTSECFATPSNKAEKNLIAVVAKATEEDPRRRWRSAEAMRMALEKIQTLLAR